MVDINFENRLLVSQKDGTDGAIYSCYRQIPLPETLLKNYDNIIVSVGGDWHYVEWYSGGYINIPENPHSVSIAIYSLNANGNGEKYRVRMSVKGRWKE